MFHNYATHTDEAEAVEQDDRGRWFIKPAFAGYNSTRNNLDGYKDRESAEAAIRFYQGRYAR